MIRIFFRKKMVFICFLISNFSIANSSEAPWVGQSFSGKPCYRDGIDDISVARLDYTKYKAGSGERGVVEAHHFTNDIQTLRKGHTSTIPMDIHYTLTAFPNHIKALYSLIKYEDFLKLGVHKDPLITDLECYFQRAINFSTHDVAIRALYASYLNKRGRTDDADKLYKVAINMVPGQYLIRYNYGIFLVKQKKYEEAMDQAKIIYKANFPEQKLKKILKDVGHWDEEFEK